MAAMFKSVKILPLLVLLLSTYFAKGSLNFPSVLTNLTANLLKMKHSIIFACNQADLRRTSSALLESRQFVYPINMQRNYTLDAILTRKSHARTAVIVDCACNETLSLLQQASSRRYFNKTYQWLLWDYENVGLEALLPTDLTYFGPNAQVTYLNESEGFIKIWDVHSKGRHLGSPLEVQLIADSNLTTPHELNICNDIFELQSVRRRDHFHGLTLRGATVIDLDNITTTAQIEKLLAVPRKQTGISAFTKYHYELVRLLRDRFNFTINFRNARGWAGRLENTTFRLGYLGILQRHEADIGASAIYNRLNRFAEFDIIHQSWKYETAFLYRLTTDLDVDDKSGNFMAPFDMWVWYLVFGTMITMNITWRLIEWINGILARKFRELSQHQHAPDNSETSLVAVILKTFAAMCQQGLDPLPRGLASRTIVFTIFLFSLIIYNYYTSSVVGGLLSSTTAGPATVDEVVSSPLKLSFEDIGYYKVLFKEKKTPTVLRLIESKLMPARSAADLPIYSHIDEAIPYLKNGTFAFHCEVVDAYPEIARHFDANEICDLRVVTGLQESEIMNFVLPKNSQYAELFRNAMCHSRETGFIERLLRKRQPRKPPCLSLYTVYPVKISGVSTGFMILCAGFFLAILALIVEVVVARLRMSRANQHF